MYGGHRSFTGRLRFVEQVQRSASTWIAHEGAGVLSGANFTISIDGEPLATADGHGAWIERAVER